MLPQEFTTYTRQIMGEERWQRFVDAFDADTPVSIRINPFKSATTSSPSLASASLSPTPISHPLTDVQVPWCRNAFYLKERPNFTRDPLLHAGVYYVQEASSMFLDTALRQILPDVPVQMLDLCAAPGGKSTLSRAALPEGSTLYSNEPNRTRANILMENLQKQGHPGVIVTNNYATDYRKAKLLFDVILCDVPCSGEGMFRKDEGAISEWSLQNVMKCAALQRSIIEDIWQCLKPGGTLIYSTCTYNLHENEENVRWIMETLGADIIPLATENEWNITGSLLPEWDKPVYRFIPGKTRGEGLFMAVLRKTSDDTVLGKPSPSALRILSDGNPQPTVKGKNVIPAHAEALLINLPADKYPRTELSLDDALRYLHHEALALPADVPKGFVVVTYQSHPLGFVKNIGNRANNLYPQEWKIRNL